LLFAAQLVLVLVLSEAVLVLGSPSAGGVEMVRGMGRYARPTDFGGRNRSTLGFEHEHDRENR
jgi:hypothetical protein